MQIQVQHVCGRKSGSRQLGNEQFVDDAIALLPDLVRRGGGGMGGNNESHARSFWEKEDIRAIVEATGSPAFWMPTLCVCWPSQAYSYFFSLQQRVIFTARNHAQPTAQDIGQRSGIAIQTVEADHDLGKRKGKCQRVPGHSLQSTVQFLPIFPIARSRIRAEPLMGKRLENGGPGSHDFPAFAPGVAGGTNLAHPTMGGGKSWLAWERTLAGSLSSAIHIHDPPLVALPVR